MNSSPIAISHHFSENSEEKRTGFLKIIIEKIVHLLIMRFQQLPISLQVRIVQQEALLFIAFFLDRQLLLQLLDLRQLGQMLSLILLKVKMVMLVSGKPANN